MLNVIKFEVDFQVKWLSATKQTLNIYFDLLSNKKLASRSLMLEQNPRDGRAEIQKKVDANYSTYWWLPPASSK